MTSRPPWSWHSAIPLSASARPALCAKQQQPSRTCPHQNSTNTRQEQSLISRFSDGCPGARPDETWMGHGRCGLRPWDVQSLHRQSLRPVSPSVGEFQRRPAKAMIRLGHTASGHAPRGRRGVRQQSLGRGIHHAWGLAVWEKSPPPNSRPPNHDGAIACAARPCAAELFRSFGRRGFN